MELKNYKDLERVVVFGNYQTNIHTIFKKGKMYFIYYGNTKEFVWTEDENGLEPGLYKYKDLSLSREEKVTFKEDTYSPHHIFILIMECENIMYVQRSTDELYISY